MKEMEKIGGKAGVVTQTIKDVLQSLVDDSMVDLEKIGSANYYWSFPSKALCFKQKQVDGLKAEIAALEAKVTEGETTVAELTTGREESDDRTTKLARLTELEAEETKLQSQIDMHRENDPAVLEDLEAKRKTCHEAANRWTDNIFAIQKYVKGMGVDMKEFNKGFGIKDDFDYVE